MTIAPNIIKLGCVIATAILVISCVLGREEAKAGVEHAKDFRRLAFPGAEGGGKYTTGGRGGMVIKVTNLNDSGPGSLRQAIETPDPRTVIFEVSGTILLESPLHINYGNLTIAGQTAPGEGICLKGHETRIYADNVIIRFMRFRPGDISGNEYDALTAMRRRNIIIDHCSMSWSTDETSSFYDNENFSMQWCIISESLNNSVHSKGAHGYGGIWGGKNASFTKNILAHHNSRNPRLQGTRYNPIEDTEKIEIINNIVYNWGEKAIYGGENGRYNIIKNIFILGPATSNSARAEILEPYEPFGKFFLEGNVFLHENQHLVEAGSENIFLPEKTKRNIISRTPFNISTPAIINSIADSYEWLLDFCGASLHRDKIDERIVKEVRTRTYSFGNSGIIDSQDQVGGWPILKSESPPLDSDGDGIPDHWEKMHGLDPKNPDDGNLFTIDEKYTNLEMYLNDLVKGSFPTSTF